MSYVRTLCLEDWEEQYQWSDTTVNLILPGKIMSEQEIQDISISASRRFVTDTKNRLFHLHLDLSEKSLLLGRKTDESRIYGK